MRKVISNGFLFKVVAITTQHVNYINGGYMPLVHTTTRTYRYNRLFGTRKLISSVTIASDAN